MTTAEPPIDKTSWGPGPWQNEPDRVEFIASGFAALALRHPENGHWCGYIGVPREHPAYGKGYDDIEVSFHGGLTYAAACDGERVCHVAAPGMPDDVWWLGGDFAHGFDYCPGMAARMREIHADLKAKNHPSAWAFESSPFERENDGYRDLNYVRENIESLAAQLREMTH